MSKTNKFELFTKDFTSLWNGALANNSDKAEPKIFRKTLEDVLTIYETVNPEFVKVEEESYLNLVQELFKNKLSSPRSTSLKKTMEYAKETFFTFKEKVSAKQDYINENNLHPYFSRIQMNSYTSDLDKEIPHFDSSVETTIIEDVVNEFLNTIIGECVFKDYIIDERRSLIVSFGNILQERGSLNNGKLYYGNYIPEIFLVSNRLIEKGVEEKLIKFILGSEETNYYIEKISKYSMFRTFAHEMGHYVHFAHEKYYSDDKALQSLKGNYAYEIASALTHEAYADAFAALVCFQKAYLTKDENYINVLVDYSSFLKNTKLWKKLRSDEILYDWRVQSKLMEAVFKQHYFDKNFTGRHIKRALKNIKNHYEDMLEKLNYGASNNLHALEYKKQDFYSKSMAKTTERSNPLEVVADTILHPCTETKIFIGNAMNMLIPEISKADLKELEEINEKRQQIKCSNAFDSFKSDDWVKYTPEELDELWNKEAKNLEPDNSHIIFSSDGVLPTFKDIDGTMILIDHNFDIISNLNNIEYYPFIKERYQSLIFDLLEDANKENFDSIRKTWQKELINKMRWLGLIKDM
jgi:hypothetical protein